MKQNEFINKIQDIISNFLDKRGFYVHEFHLGKVACVNSDGTLDVYIDASTTITPSVPANPDVKFAVNDHIWVHFVNKNPNNLFVPYKRHVI
ncbi:hypothetical protein PV797_04865 [Clostridiaceae bacterium M8S5]|nr:hypothetical protein PV797_04865 [Clostridiaceae bacterium M8S5]